MKKVLAAFAVAMALPMTVMAWEPTGDVNVIVAYKAGSGTDTGARLLATEAQKFRKPSSFRTFPVLTARSAGQN